MNNVSVNHIINVKKNTKNPKIKSTENRAYLETVRSQVGSNFNLIASQFENFDMIIFTEDKYDYNLIKKLSLKYYINKKAFNIPIHGFQEYKKAKHYKEAYELLIGKRIEYVCVLDKDYYPEIYLAEVKEDLNKEGVKTIFTLGKEIENILIKPKILEKVFGEKLINEYKTFLNLIYKKEYHNTFGTFITLHEKFSIKRIDSKTIIKKEGPIFEKKWNSDKGIADFCPGKLFFKHIKRKYKDLTKQNLVEDLILDNYVDEDNIILENWIKRIFNEI